MAQNCTQLCQKVIILYTKFFLKPEIYKIGAFTRCSLKLSELFFSFFSHTKYAFAFFFFSMVSKSIVFSKIEQFGMKLFI